MPGSGRHLYRLTLRARLQRTRHGLVQLSPLRRMETTVQVFLKQDVPKAIVGEVAVSQVLDVDSSHQKNGADGKFSGLDFTIHLPEMPDARRTWSTAAAQAYRQG